jgi:twinkle protein
MHDNGAAFLDQQAAARPQVVRAKSYQAQVEQLWTDGLPRGSLTGWPSLDQYYTVAPGQWTLVTGYPSMGKSEFVDALAVNLSHQGWKFLVYSPENQPTSVHLAKLSEKLAGKPFGVSAGAERMSLAEAKEHLATINERFRFIQPALDSPPTIPELLEAITPELAELSGTECVPVGVVIDPWNEVETSRQAGMSETEFVSKSLTQLRNWARHHNVHVWLVAHPQKMKRENGKLPIPTPDSVSGSAHFWNKADCALTVHIADRERDEVNILVQKMRFKHLGRRGLTTLRYDISTGRYRDISVLPRPVTSWA